MNLNHSVVIIGWGVDPDTGTKFWKVRNSYGKQWGLNGDFLVRRGENDFGIESETTAYDVRMCSAINKQFCVEVKQRLKQIHHISFQQQHVYMYLDMTLQQYKQHMCESNKSLTSSQWIAT